MSDSTGIIKVGVVEASYTARAGEVIYIGGYPVDDEQMALAALENTVIHELAHNLGLADLYGAWLNFDGSPSQAWPPEFSRRFLNVDGPGCPKWCNGFKPASEYVDSPTAICRTFESKDACITYNRDAMGDCTSTGDDGNYECCVWDDDQPFEYFGGHCAPHQGTENIGLDCLAGAGCYFGAAQSQYAWRSTNFQDESLMSSPYATAFSSVEVRALTQVVDCCLTATDADPLCADFRQEYADFLHENNFKHWIGSCGVIPTDEDPPIFSE